MWPFNRKREEPDEPQARSESTAPVLINAYCTLRTLPPLEFPHRLNARRDRTDPNLRPHLEGLARYAFQKSGGQMTQLVYHVLGHIRRVQQHLSLSVSDEDFPAFHRWARDANAVYLLPDGSVRDPEGRVLVDPAGKPPDGLAAVPHPPDALARKARSEERIRDLGIHVLAHLPPVIGEGEVDLRPAEEVARRVLALFLVALHAESLATNEQIAVADLREEMPLAFEALSPKEKEFLETEFPEAPSEQQAVIDAAWRYETLFLLQWALRLADDLPFPTAICDVPRVARVMLDTEGVDLVRNAALRPTPEILDALDLHYRLHWAARDASLNRRDPPGGLDEGVITERHYALNWLIRFEDADWDDVDTPT